MCDYLEYVSDFSTFSVLQRDSLRIFAASNNNIQQQPDTLLY